MRTQSAGVRFDVVTSSTPLSSQPDMATLMHFLKEQFGAMDTKLDEVERARQRCEESLRRDVDRALDAQNKRLDNAIDTFNVVAQQLAS